MEHSEHREHREHIEHHIFSMENSLKSGNFDSVFVFSKERSIEKILNFLIKEIFPYFPSSLDRFF